MPHQTWREQIGGWIADALNEGRRQGLEGKDLATYVRDRTYTGEAVAGHWGLKVWREEFDLTMHSAAGRANVR